MKKYITGIAMIISLCIFTGCGAQPPVVDMNETNMTQMSEIQTTEDDKELTQETTVDDKNMTFVSQNGSTVKENEDSVYFFRKDSIYAVDKASKQVRIFWKKEDYEPDYYMFDGSGILLGDKIYFLEEMERHGDGIYYAAGVLSVIHTDGTGYKQELSTLDEADASDGVYGINSIYYSDNILYVYNIHSVRCYRVLEDGSLGEEISREETAFRYTQDLGEEYSLLCKEGDMGNYLSPVESLERYGSLIMKKGTSYVKIDVENGTEEWLNFGAPEFMDQDKVFYDNDAYDVWKLESFDIHTKEVEVIAEINDVGVISGVYDNGTFYYMSNKGNQKITVGCISVSGGMEEVLFELDASGYVNGFSPFGLMVSGDYLYYMDMRDYDAYLIQVPLDNLSQEEVLEEPIYSTNINKVGELAKEHHDVYKENDPDRLLGTADFCWLVVDDSFAGAETINEYLYESEVVSERAVFEDNVRADEEFIDELSVPYSYSTDVSRIRYVDGTYVSFIQEGYDYSGGAHGLPYWEGYTFNLDTGERLLLMDILSNTEDELKDIVTKYFAEKIDENPSEFWADAKEAVHDTISLETTDFVLTEDGICFYMHPYSISAYAAGFQEVTIPYSEFRDLRFSPQTR